MHTLQDAIMQAKGTHNMSIPASMTSMESTGKGVAAKHPPCGKIQLSA